MASSLQIDRELVFKHRGKTIIRLRNNSGGTVNAGAPVIYDTTTTDAFTTTTAQNDGLIAGMCMETVANGAYAKIQQSGFTDLLKVDGTTDIAVGDFLTTFTTAGIAAKRSANTSVGQFALALEAYTTNDGNGVIDAWLFAPNRVAGATSSWGDNTLLQLGTDNDIALVERSTALAANTTLAGVVEGTAATLATAADSLMVGNVTNDGDVHIVVSKAGNTHTAFLADGSTGDTILNAATGQSVDLYVAGTKEYDFSATAIDLNANHLDNAGYLIMNAVTLPASTEVYIGQDNAGDATVNALTGKTVNMAVAGTDVATFGGTAITFSQPVTLSGTNNLTVGGDLTVTGALTFGGNWTVGATLTVDELILDTDGVAPAATNCYWVRDNAGDLTGNAITGKQVIVAINNTDEYTFSATIADFLGNAIDNAGYLILNAATAPAATEVYLVNDNTGDLTANVLTGKDFIVAVNGVDEAKFDDAAHVINEAGNDRDFRVETDGLAYAIYSDGAKNAVVIGGNIDTSAVDAPVAISSVARTATADTAFKHVDILPGAAVTIPTGTADSVATVVIHEPNITATGTVTYGASLLIVDAPTEGTNNYGLYLGTSAHLGIIGDATDLIIGAGRDVRMRWSSADADNHAFVMTLGASLAMHICQDADIATDWNVAAASNPTLYVHGATTPATEYVALSTDETDAHLNAVGANWSVEIGGTAELTLSATVINAKDNTVAGSSASHTADTADGSLYLQSTSHATKGFVALANADLGLVIGSDGSVDRATTVGTNSIHIFNGTAPAGTLANGISIYSTGGECYIMDAGGTATLQTQHDSDGDFIEYAYSAIKNKTVVIHLEKLLRKLAAKFPGEFNQFFEETTGMVPKHERVAKGLSRV